MEDLEEDLSWLPLQSADVQIITENDAHELIDAKATTKNPFSLEIHEIILGFLVHGPSFGTPKRFESGESIPELYALPFERNNGFRGVGVSRWLRNVCQECVEDGFRIGWYACLGGIWIDRYRGLVWGLRVGGLINEFSGTLRLRLLDVYVVLERSTEAGSIIRTIADTELDGVRSAAGERRVEVGLSEKVGGSRLKTVEGWPVPVPSVFMPETIPGNKRAAR